MWQFLIAIVAGCFVLWRGFAFAETPGANHFVGASHCAGCHETESRLWQQSDHFKSMQPANDATVLGDFNNKQVQFLQIKSRFSNKNGEYFITTKGIDGESTFKVRYTFGYYPLQQYLLETTNGRLQAFDVAWDARPKTEGGQIWYHLQPNDSSTQQQVFFWQNHFQNWNSRCADCHSTNVSKQYDPAQRSYKTEFSEVNVACEACHGPASEHLLLAKQNALSQHNTGFSRRSSEAGVWRFSEHEAIAHRIDKFSLAEPNSGDHALEGVDLSVNTCGRCHSLRTRLESNLLDKPFAESYSLNLLDETQYYSDGQIKEEDFVLGSFLQSKMYAAGVTCANCHEPHSGKLLAEGNSLCAQCHKPSVYDQTSHHQHSKSAVARSFAEGTCIECHMPSRIYMGVDARRDHKFHIPDALLAKAIGVPLACKNCHGDKEDDWFVKALGQAGADEAQRSKEMNRIGDIKYRAQHGDVSVVPVLIKQFSQGSMPAIVRASLWQASVDVLDYELLIALRKDLAHSSALVRRGALSALAGAPADDRWQAISKMRGEKNPAVRYQMAEVILPVFPALSTEQKKSLEGLLSEYRHFLLGNQDTPTAQLGLADFAIAKRKPVEAEAAYLEALKIAPGYLPAELNLADLYRAMGQPEASEKLLRQAVSSFPGSGLANYSYGLHLIRQKDYRNSLIYLERATKAEDANSNFYYVYALALFSTGSLDAATMSLETANARWPNQPLLLSTLVDYYSKQAKQSSLGSAAFNRLIQQRDKLIVQLRQLGDAKPG